jgi:hypothetical protein
MKDVGGNILKIGNLTIPFDTLAEKKEFLEDWSKTQNFNERLFKGMNYNTFVSESKILEPKAYQKFEVLEFGPCYTVATERNLNVVGRGIIEQTPLLHYRIYAGNSIKNSPDYDGDLESFVKANLNRVVVRSFLLDNGKKYHRFYLKKYKNSTM